MENTILPLQYYKGRKGGKHSYPGKDLLGKVPCYELSKDEVSVIRICFDNRQYELYSSI